MCILMELQKTPNICDYWFRNSFFRSNLIRLVFTQDRFQTILRTLHCVNNETRSISREDPNFDKVTLVNGS